MATFTLLAQQNRNGTITSASVAVPSTIVNVTLRLTMPSAVLTNTANTATAEVEGSFNGGAAWNVIGAFSWQGGPGTGPGGLPKQPPSLRWAPLPDGLTHARGRLILNRSMQVGLALDVT